jgi:hypothetical protein
MASVRIRGDFRFRAFINLLIFKIAYTKTGSVDRVFDLPAGVSFSRTLPIPGPFDIHLSVTENQHLEKPVAHASVHLDGIEQAALFSWTKPLDVSTSIPVKVEDLRNGNHFRGEIDFTL